MVVSGEVITSNCFQIKRKKTQILNAGCIV